MDTKIERKSRKIYNIMKLSVAILLFIGLISFVFNNKRSANVYLNDIQIKKVEKGNFEDFIIIQAKTEPIQTILLNIIEGGAIQEIFTENGSKVNKGQPIARIYNPNSSLNYMNQQTQIIEQINQLNKSKIELNEQAYQLKNEELQLMKEFNESEKNYKLHQRMFEDEILARNTWEQTQNNFQFIIEKKENFYEKKKINLIQQKNQIKEINQTLKFMQENLNMLKSNQNNYLITALESGILTSFEPIIGKNYTSGESIGKIDRQLGYKLIAEVDEFYKEKIHLGITGNLEFKGKLQKVSVSKIIPEIRNGKFKVELCFNNKNEFLKVSQGLNLGIKLIVSDKKNATLLPKGQYDTDTYGKWVFVVKNNKAVKRNIKVNLENSLYYEVISGLNPGEKVIVSNYGEIKEMEELNIK